jgi:hypothetical protein
MSVQLKHVADKALSSSLRVSPAANCATQTTGFRTRSQADMLKPEDRITPLSEDQAVRFFQANMGAY